MWFHTVVFRNLTGRLTRSILTAVAVGVAVGTVVALFGVADNFRETFTSMFENRGVDMVVVRHGVDRLSSYIPEKVGDQLRGLPHVQTVAPGLIDVTSFPNTSLHLVPVYGRFPDSLMFQKLKVLPGGRALQEGDEKVAVLGMVLAKNLGKKVGDTVTLYEDEFTVIGIFESFNPMENGAVFVPLRELQERMGRPGLVTSFIIVFEKGLDKTKAEEDFRKGAEQMTDDEGHPSNLTALSTLDHVTSIAQLTLAEAMAWLTSTVALVIGAVGMLNTMLSSVFERTCEIGILRALGWTKSRILWLILWESWFICLAGAVLGIAGAYAIIYILNFHPTLAGTMSPWIPPIVAVKGLGVGAIMGFVGGIYPAIRASLLLPAEALRHE